MDEVLRRRRAYRAGSITFNVGMFLAILLLVAIMANVIAMFIWLLIFMLVAVACIITLCTILLSAETRATFNQWIQAPFQAINVIQTIAYYSAIPVCVVSGCLFISSFVLLLCGTKRKGQTVKIVFCFIGLAAAIIACAIIVTTGLPGAE